MQNLKALSAPVLLTGHTGFKGTWLSLLLNQLEIDYFGVSLEAETDSLYHRLNRPDLFPGVISDIRNLSALNQLFSKVQPAVVIHMAAQPLVLKSYGEPRETFEINVIGTANILEAAFNTSSVKVVLVITTDKVYRNENSGKRFKESDPLFGKDPYSLSKVGAEAASSAWRQISETSGGPKVIVARAGNVVGGGDFAKDRIIPDIIRGVVGNQAVTIRNPNSTRPWQHVLDPLIGYLMYIDQTLIGSLDIPALNFGPLEPSLKVQEILEIGKVVFGERLIISHIAEEKEREALTLELDATCATQNLNWTSHWSQRKAIDATFKWWLDVIERNESAYVNCLREIDSLLQNRAC
jgi:CDP-glucose 4,6-dehydratase